MYEEYLQRGGTKSRAEFDRLLNQMANAISGYYLFVPPRQKLLKTAFHYLCKGV
jgi:hypothetical protein